MGVPGREEREATARPSASRDGAEVQHNGAIVTPQFAFGSTARGKGGMAFLEGDKLMFPAGVHAATYRPSNEEMRLALLADGVRCATHLVLSPNRKYFATVEDTAHSRDATAGAADDSPRVDTLWSVSVYSISTGKRVKAITPDDCLADAATTVGSISFSNSSKLLMVHVCGTEEQSLLIYRWYLGKLLLTVALDFPAVEAVFSPLDDGLIAAIGSKAATVQRLDLESCSSRNNPIAAADVVTGDFTAVCWLVGNLVAIATQRGRVRILQDNDVKATLTPDPADELATVMPKGRGFMTAGRKGVVYMYEAVDVSSKKSGGSKDMFQLVWSLDAHIPGRTVVSLALSPAEDGVAALTSMGELLYASLTQAAERDEKNLEAVLGRCWEMIGDAEHEPFRMIGGGVGGSKVLGMDASSQQPLLAVLTANKMLRVINYATKRPLVIRQLLDDVLCVALHPSGTMLLVGMHDKLALFSIALDELHEVTSFGVKKCHLVRYSHGGAKFAAVGRSNAIGIYHAYRHTQLALLKGHVSWVTDMVFSADERLLCSVGAGGAVYFWDLAAGIRIAEAEYVDKRCIYTSVALAGGGAAGGVVQLPSAVVRGVDGRLQHVCGGRVEFEARGPPGSEAACMQLLGGGRILMAVDMHGGLTSFSWPVTFPAPAGYDAAAAAHHTRLHAGSGPISHMVAFQELSLLLTASVDGTVLMSSLTLVLGGTLMEGGGVPGPGSALPATVPVPVERLASNATKLMELAGSLATVKSDAEYAAFRTAQALREALARTEAELAGLRTTLEAREAELAQERSAAGVKEHDIVKALEGVHMTAVEELEALFDARLALEAQKLLAAKAAADDRLFAAQEAARRAQAAHAAELAALNDKVAEVAAAGVEALARAHEEAAEVSTFWEEYAVQAEADAEEADARLNARLDSAVAAAADREGVLRGELTICKRASLRLKGEKALDAKRIDKLLRDNSRLQTSLDEAGEVIGKLKRELAEREAVLADNFAQIQELRHRIQDLEKHKYVLSYKAEAYWGELEPRREEVRALRAEVDAQQSEMVAWRTETAKTARSITEKDARVKSLKAELAAAKLTAVHQASALSCFSADLATVYNASDERPAPGKKSARQQRLEELYSKYVIHASTSIKAGGQVEAELQRHLHMSELNNALTHHRLQAVHDHTASERRSLIHQNTTLLRELQVALQDNRELGRSVAGMRAAVRELTSRHAVLEGRWRASTTDAPPAGSDARGKSAGVQLEGRTQGLASTGALVTPLAPGVTGQGMGRPRPQSAAPQAMTHRFRTAGGALGHGTLMRGSTSRALQEMVAGERERADQLADELATSAQEVERQQTTLTQLHSMLRALVEGVGEAKGQVSGDQQPDQPEPAGGQGTAVTTQPLGPSDGGRVSPDSSTVGSSGMAAGPGAGAAVRSRPASALPLTAARLAGVAAPAAAQQASALASSSDRDSLLSDYATQASMASAAAIAKRRPTSAAGVGLRAYLSPGRKRRGS